MLSPPPAMELGDGLDDGPMRRPTVRIRSTWTARTSAARLAALSSPITRLPMSSGTTIADRSDDGLAAGLDGRRSADR